MSEKMRLGIAVVYMLADQDAGWVDRVFMVLQVYGFSDDESKEALKLSGVNENLLHQQH